MAKMPADYICSIADALQAGDMVYLNDRARPVEVLGREEDRNSGLINSSDYPYKIVWLRGNGTEYRLRYSHTGKYYPHLHTESQLESGKSFSVKHQEPRHYTRSTTSGERVQEISVEGVDDEALTDWAFHRNIEVIENTE